MSSYQNLLNIMGINFAIEMVKTDKSNEIKMWRAVINNALLDVAINLSDRKSSLQKLEAHYWIYDNSKDFQQVCFWADLDPDNVRLQYLRAVAKNKIKFTDRQIKWKKYNDNYQKLKNIQDKEERKKLRKIVEYLRNIVFHASLKEVSII